MIYAYEIYELLLTEIRKDKRGKSLSVDEYNRISKQVNLELFTDYYRKFEGNIESSDALGGLKVYDAQVVVTADTNDLAAVGTLPADYFHIIGKPRYYSGSTIRWLDVVSTYEHAIRHSDYLTQATATHPYCELGGLDDDDGVEIRVYPYDLGASVYIDYLKEPDTPFLDYYINNTTLNYSWLSAGATSVNIPSGYTYRTGTIGGASVYVNSSTVNWEWGEDNLPIIMAKMLMLLGIQLPDEILVQAGAMNETKLLR